MKNLGNLQIEELEEKRNILWGKVDDDSINKEELLLLKEIERTIQLKMQYKTKQFEFTTFLKVNNIDFRIRGDVISVIGENINLRSLKYLPENVSFDNYGHVDLFSLEHMSKNVKFSDHVKNIDLDSLKYLPENMQFNNSKGVCLRSLESLPESTQFNNGWYVDLRSLKSMPENIQFNNGGDVNLRSLKSLPENTQFNNKGDVKLYKLESLPEITHFNNEGNVIHYIKNKPIKEESQSKRKPIQKLREYKK